MKKIYVAFFVVVALLWVIWPVLACDPQRERCSELETSVDGTAYQAVVKEHGTDDVGGWAGGESEGSFAASGRSFAIGEAKAKGEAGGSDIVSDNSASTFSKSVVMSGAEANGRTGQITLSGKAEQANWAVVGSDNNFALGENTSKAEYQTTGVITGGHHGCQGGEIEGFGLAKAEGGTVVSVYEAPGLKQAEVSTTGSSLALVKPAERDCDPVASGLSDIRFYNNLTGDRFQAVGGGIGTAKYDATGPSMAGGSLAVTGTSSTQAGPGSVKAVSEVSSKAFAISR